MPEQHSNSKKSSKKKKEQQIPAAFWERADAVIQLANQQVDNANLSEVSASLLYGAARFHAFVIACAANSAEEIIEEKDETMRYFLAQYEKMLTENIDDYIVNFEEYTQEENQ